MKKFISLLLCVLMICAAGITVFADDADSIKECVTDENGNVFIDDGCEYVISDDLTVNSLDIANGTLTIPAGKTLTVNADSTVHGTLNISGTINVTAPAKLDSYYCTINRKCTGKIDGEFTHSGCCIMVIHNYVDGVCVDCTDEQKVLTDFTDIAESTGVININDGQEYTLSRDCAVKTMNVTNGTLTIPRGITLTVVEEGTVYGTLNVDGTLNIADHIMAAYATINRRCIGSISGPIIYLFSNVNVIHAYHPDDNICDDCNEEKINDFTAGVLNSNSIKITDGGSYILNRSCKVKELNITKGTLIIPAGITLSLDVHGGTNAGTISVCGTLDLSATTNSPYHLVNTGTINCQCPGKIIWRVYDSDGNRVDINTVHNCDETGVCRICGKTIATDSGSPNGFTVSVGSSTVIVGIAGLAVGFLTAMLIFRKRENDDIRNDPQ